VVASVVVQGAAYATYALTRPEVHPHLTIQLTGEGRGHVLVTRVGDNAPLVRCVPESAERERLADLPPVDGVVASAKYLDGLARQVRDRGAAPGATKVIVGPSCRFELPAGTEVRLTAVLDEGATFGGYHQLPMRTPAVLVPLLGDPLATCLDGDLLAAAANPLDCPVTVTADTKIAAEFGLMPEEIDVSFTPEQMVAELVQPPPEAPPPPPIDAEKLEDKPLEVAITPPPKEAPPPPIPPPPPPPPPEQNEPKPIQPPPPNQVMVEVKDDKNVVEEAPDDATKLSDKNRDVAEETRADETNLEKESEGKQVASAESDNQDPEIGGPEDQIRQLEQTEATTDERVRETDHSGTSEVAKGGIVGEGGDNGEEGTGERSPGVLSMRGIGGRGRIVDQGKDGRKSGKRGTPGLNTPLAFEDYERIMGREKVDEERQVAARKMSAKKGRWERKLAAIKSSLENFVPDVRVGNQTALKTRAHPFAVYIARMHRRIHELWAFDFLDNLDEKSHSHHLNNPDLWVNLEVSVNPDGSVHKVTIAKTSGETEFDVAAIDVVLSSAPFEQTPEAIRSADGRVYLRWGFYRNYRQCGTFNVEPYILTDIPTDSSTGVLDDGELVRNTAKLPGKKRAPVGGTPVTPDDGRAKQRVSPKTSVTDKEAVFAANLWVSAFATASVDKLVKYSSVPFYAAGQVAAQTAADLKDMYSGLIVESGPMKEWKLLTPSEYGAANLPEGSLVLQVRTTKEAFAIVLTRTKSGDFRATQIAR